MGREQPTPLATVRRHRHDFWIVRSDPMADVITPMKRQCRNLPCPGGYRLDPRVPALPS
jgi:hypothetical protein